MIANTINRLKYFKRLNLIKIYDEMSYVDKNLKDLRK